MNENQELHGDLFAKFGAAIWTEFNQQTEVVLWGQNKTKQNKTK